MSFIHQCSKYGSIAKRLWTARWLLAPPGWHWHWLHWWCGVTISGTKRKKYKMREAFGIWVWWAHVLCHMWAQFAGLNCDCVLWFVFANSADSISGSQLLSEAFEISNIYRTSTFAHEAVSSTMQSNMKIWECVMIRQLQLVVLFIGIFIPNLFSWTI